MHKTTANFESLNLGHREVYDYFLLKTFKTQFKITVFNTNSTGGTWFIQDHCYVSSVVIRRNEIVFIDKFEIFRQQRRREIILHLSNIRDEHGTLRRLGKIRKHGNNCKYSSNSRSSGNLVTLTTLITKLVANVSRASPRASDIFIWFYKIV